MGTFLFCERCITVVAANRSRHERSDQGFNFLKNTKTYLPRKSVLALAFLALLLIAASTATAQTNLLSNGGFELGNASGWTSWGNTLTATTAQKRTGTYSGLTSNRHNSWEVATINALPLTTAGKTYQFSVWVKLAAGAADTPVSLNLSWTDANPRQYATLQPDTTVTASGWTQLSGIFTFSPTGTATELSIYLNCASVATNIYVDDALLSVTDNLLTNPGFESGNPSGWSAAGSSIAASTSEKRSGQYGGYVTGRTAEWHGAWINDLQTVLTSGKTYRVSLWIKPAAGTDITVQLTTKQTNGGSDVYGPVLQQRVCAAGEWSELSGGFTYINPGNTTALSVYLYCFDTTRSYAIDDAEVRLDEVSVDLAATGAAAAHKAIGFLHGLSDTLPSTSHYEALKPVIQRFPAFLANPNMLGSPTGFGSAAYMNRLKAVGARQQVLVSDEYMWFGLHTSWGWPGDAAHKGYTSYQLLDEKIDSIVDYALANFPAASGWQIEWDLWNEPDNADFWGRSQAQFFETWKHAFQRVRAKDPNAVIVGPSIAYFVTQGANPTRAGWLKAFLLYARDNNVLPDIVSWHEMVNAKEIPAQVQMVRDFMAANGIADRPIDVNEYQGPGADLMQSPGNAVRFISNLENTNIRSAIRACWNEDAAQTDGTTNGLFPGRLDNIMTTTPFQPRALWHLYQSYSEMSGNMVPVTPGGFLSGLASVDAAAGRARILVGNDGTQAFTTKVTIANLSQLADFPTTGKVRVRVREIPFAGLNALGAPTEVSNAILTPVGGTLEVPLNVTSRGAYEITLEAAAPKVTSITPVAGAGTGQAQYRVVFDRAITGFDSAADVTISGSGATVTFGNITPESPTSYLVNLINVSGSGSITLTVAGTSLTSTPTAETILVDNFSFETALGAAGSETSNWATSTWAKPSYTAPTLAPTNGTQIASSNSENGTISQVLDAYQLVAGDQVTLRIDFGWPAPTTWGGASVAVSSVSGPNGTLAMGSFDAVQPPANGWNTLTIPLTVSAQQAGGFLKVVITRGPSGVQTVIDNVRAEVVRATAGMPGITSAPAPSLFTLQTSALGNGTVSRSPNSAAYPAGTLVQLTATPQSGYKLTNWTGGATGTTNPFPLTINAATSVAANFSLNSGIYAGWSIQKLGSIQSPTDDFDHDGVSNLLEYAMGMEPGTPDAQEAPAVGTALSGRLQLTYSRNTLATDLTYTVQGVSDLTGTWQPLFNPPTEDLGTVGTVQTLRATDTVDPGSRRFLRLHIRNFP